MTGDGQGGRPRERREFLELCGLEARRMVQEARMNRYAIVPALALLLTATAGAAVDPNLLGLMMPEAKVVYGVQVQQTLASPFGQYAISHLPQNDAMTHFEAATGFDLQRDLREILVASSTTGNLNDGSDALVLASDDHTATAT
jgi:hypothetical protein